MIFSLVIYTAFTIAEKGGWSSKPIMESEIAARYGSQYLGLANSSHLKKSFQIVWLPAGLVQESSVTLLGVRYVGPAMDLLLIQGKNWDDLSEVGYTLRYAAGVTDFTGWQVVYRKHHEQSVNKGINYICWDEGGESKELELVNAL